MPCPRTVAAAGGCRVGHIVSAFWIRQNPGKNNLVPMTACHDARQRHCRTLSQRLSRVSEAVRRLELERSPVNDSQGGKRPRVRVPEAISGHQNTPSGSKHQTYLPSGSVIAQPIPSHLSDDPFDMRPFPRVPGLLVSLVAGGCRWLLHHACPPLRGTVTVAVQMPRFKRCVVDFADRSPPCPGTAPSPLCRRHSRRRRSHPLYPSRSTFFAWPAPTLIAK